MTTARLTEPEIAFINEHLKSWRVPIAEMNVWQLEELALYGHDAAGQPYDEGLRHAAAVELERRR